MAIAFAPLLGDATAAIPAAPLPKNLPHNPTVVRLLNEAQVALAKGDIRQALIDLKLAAGMEPNNPTVISRLGIALNQNGDFADAEEELRYARSLGVADDQVLGPLFEAMLTLGKNQAVLDLFADPAPTNRTALAATILRARASALQKLGNNAGALSAINRALAIRRDFDTVMTAARIALLQRNFANAQSFCDEALRLSPNNTDAITFEIGFALVSNDSTRALSIAEQLVADKPSSLVARLARAKVYLALGKTEKAKPDIDRILKESPNMAIALYYRSIILARSGKFAAAWTVAHVLPSEFVQSDEEVAVNVADMAAAAGFLDSAATILNTAVFKNPSLLEARLKLVEYRLRQNSPQYALNALAMVEDSKDPRVSILFAQAYLTIHHQTDAQRYIKRAIELGGGQGLTILGSNVALTSLRDWLQQHPKNLEVRKQYALLLLRFGDLPNARIQYEQLVREASSDGVSLNNLSWLVLKDDPRRSLMLAAQAVKLNPTSPDFLDTLGCVQMSRSDMKGALKSLKQAHTLRQSDPTISYHLVLALEANGMRPQAKALLAAAVAQGGFSDLINARKLLASWH